MNQPLNPASATIEKLMDAHAKTFDTYGGTLYVARDADSNIEYVSIETVVGELKSSSDNINRSVMINFSLVAIADSNLPLALATLDYHGEDSGREGYLAVNLTGNKDAELARFGAELEDWDGCEDLLDTAVEKMGMCFDLFAALGDQVEASTAQAPSPALVPITEYRASVFTEARVGVAPFSAASPCAAVELVSDLCLHSEVAGRGESHSEDADDNHSNQALITRPGEWTEGGPLGVLLDPLVDGEIAYGLTMTFAEGGVLDLDCIHKLWKLLGDHAVNSKDKILNAFLHFPAGTHREVIWAWFETCNPEFSVANAQGNQPPLYSLVTLCSVNGDNEYEFVAAIQHPASMTRQAAADCLLSGWWPGETEITEIDSEAVYTLNGDECVHVYADRISGTTSEVFEALVNHARTLTIQ